MVDPRGPRDRRRCRPGVVVAMAAGCRPVGGGGANLRRRPGAMTSSSSGGDENRN